MTEVVQEYFRQESPVVQSAVEVVDHVVEVALAATVGQVLGTSLVPDPWQQTALVSPTIRIRKSTQGRIC